MFNNNAISKESALLQLRYRSLIRTQYKKHYVFIIKLSNSRPKFHRISTEFTGSANRSRTPAWIFINNILYMAYYKRWINVCLTASVLAPTCLEEKVILWVNVRQDIRENRNVTHTKQLQNLTYYMIKWFGL